ncbi:MAG TPA: hypothetical protein VFT22_29085 [Kofleriaceae bacterium]|nr:hypothetical protein [Kofleriaceae bacterium]
MMSIPSRAILLLGGLAGLAGCPSSSPSSSEAANPHVLWLASDATETQVKLVDAEPGPF